MMIKNVAVLLYVVISWLAIFAGGDVGSRCVVCWCVGERKKEGEEGEQ